MYSYCCLCILIVSLCILIVVYVLLLLVYVFLSLCMYSYSCLCILTVSLCIYIVVYVFLLLVYVFLLLSMCSYCCLCMGGRRIVKTTQLIRKKAYIIISINYMFRPTVAIIRFITDLRGSHISVGRNM